MRDISDYEREKWKTVSEERFAQELEAGDIVEPDSGNPAHVRLLDIAQGLSRELGVFPHIYIAPLMGLTEEDRLRHARYSLGGFRGNHPAQAVVIPEAADVFFTREETEAVLAHEFDHVARADLFYDKMAAVEQAEDAMREYHYHRRSQSHPERLRQAEEKRDERISHLSEASTVSEVSADGNAIRSGRASAMVAALQKMMICREVGEKMDVYTPDEVIGYIDAILESRRRTNDPIAAAQHTRETFVERLRRLEKAAENEPERPSRGR